jgi:serine/threonine protein kinase
MGEVYRATDTKLGRQVALKVLPPNVANDPDRLARFPREARAVAALNHPNVVTLYSVEESEGIHFLTMELVEGQSLDRLISGNGLPLDRIAEIAGAVRAAEGLCVAVLPFEHESGDPNSEYLSDGITETLMNSLSQLGRLRVPARSTVFRYKGRTQDPQQVGRELGAKAVLVWACRRYDRRGRHGLLKFDRVT